MMAPLVPLMYRGCVSDPHLRNELFLDALMMVVPMVIVFFLVMYLLMKISEF